MARLYKNSSAAERLIPFGILDFGFWILNALPVGSFKTLSVASLNPNGISGLKRAIAYDISNAERTTCSRYCVNVNASTPNSVLSCAAKIPA